jgi:hypothetical protein
LDSTGRISPETAKDCEEIPEESRAKHVIYPWVKMQETVENPFVSIGKLSTIGGFSTSMLVYRRVKKKKWGVLSFFLQRQ